MAQTRGERKAAEATGIQGIEEWRTCKSSQPTEIDVAQLLESAGKHETGDATEHWPQDCRNRWFGCTECNQTIDSGSLAASVLLRHPFRAYQQIRVTAQHQFL